MSNPEASHVLDQWQRCGIRGAVGAHTAERGDTFISWERGGAANVYQSIWDAVNAAAALNKEHLVVEDCGLVDRILSV